MVARLLIELTVYEHLLSFPSSRSLQQETSGTMPPKAPTKQSSTVASKEKDVDPTTGNSEDFQRKFKALLLNALRTDGEVRNAVAMIVRSRETDVFSAVVQSLEKTNVTDRIGKYSHVLFDL